VEEVSLTNEDASSKEYNFSASTFSATAFWFFVSRPMLRGL
jgi:hypothetical protein